MLWKFIMHIPDGYLSPQTTISAFSIMLVIWYLAFRQVKSMSVARLTPLIALYSAFSFVIMMFNVPVVGGSSVHVVGAVLIAILAGPWVAVISTSTTLLIQALLFGDGGVLAYGVNCLSMAVIMPFVGYATYRIISGNSLLGSKRNLIAIFIAGYVGISCAALFVAIIMGVQPLLFTNFIGTPLYGFYGLAVTIPAMMGSHLLLAGPLDGLVSMIAIGYVIKFAPELMLSHNSLKLKQRINMRAWIIMLVLVILTPLGILTGNTAFGEWGSTEVINLIGYVPQGMSKTIDLWHGILPDYKLPHMGSDFSSLSVASIISSIVGVFFIVILIFIMARLSHGSKNE